MFYYRASEQRGAANFGWLDSRHSFSFGHYYDADHMGISALRVINDDWVAPGAGFDNHGHRDMEIISYILEGSIEHKDSMGNQFIVPAGEVQRMSAGSGVTHSEFNASETQPLKFLQIWITPNKKGIEPSYEQMSVVQSSKMTPLVTPDGRDNSLSIHQDASLYRLQLSSGERHELSPTNTLTHQSIGYLHVIEGGAHANAMTDKATLKPGDGLGIIDDQLSIIASDEGLVALWFELPSK
jgi:redox-sensitive bicupin YhaK (pirin superfamily)